MYLSVLAVYTEAEFIFNLDFTHPPPGKVVKLEIHALHTYQTTPKQTKPYLKPSLAQLSHSLFKFNNRESKEIFLTITTFIPKWKLMRETGGFKVSYISNTKKNLNISSNQ